MATQRKDSPMATAAQVAKALGVSDSNVYLMAKQQKIRSYRVGGRRVRFVLEEVLQDIKGGRDERAELANGHTPVEEIVQPARSTSNATGEMIAEITRLNALVKKLRGW
jgi:excisionase family DNA binding protein